MDTEPSIRDKEDKRTIFYDFLKQNLSKSSFINTFIERKLTEPELNGTALVFKVHSALSRELCRDQNSVFINAAKFAGFDEFQITIDESLKERDIKKEEEDDAAWIQKERQAPIKNDLENKCKELLKTIGRNSRYLNQNPIVWNDLIVAAFNKPGIATIEQVWHLYETPGKGYSGGVIFLSGESGAGKTTILESLAQKIQNSVKDSIQTLRNLDISKWNDPEFKPARDELIRKTKFKLKYISAAAFSEEYQEVGARRVENTTFIEFYRELNVLIIDDIHYFDVLGRAKKSKEVLIRIIKYITNKKGVVVFASRKKCEDLTSIGNDLRLALGRGIRIPIANPDGEMKKTMFYNFIAGYEKSIDNLSSGQKEVLMQIITRQSDLREVESIATNYKAQIELLDQSPNEAVTNIKKEFSSKEKQDIGKLITGIINRGAAMTHTNLPQFRKKRERYILAVRESAIYLTYMLAVKEKGSKTNSFLSSLWGFRGPGKINSTVRAFRAMESKGYMISDAIFDPDNDVEEMLNTVYSTYREYAIKERQSKQLGNLALFANLPKASVSSEEKK